MQQLLEDFEQFRKKKYRSYKWHKRITKPFKIVYFLAVPAGILSAILPFLLPFFLPLILVGVGLFITELILYNKVFKEPDVRFRNRFKTEIMPKAFKLINPDFEYSPFEKIPERQIRGMALFKDSIVNYYGEDYVKGKVQGVEIEFCEAFLYTEKYSAGSVAGGVLVNLFGGEGGDIGADGNEFAKQVRFFSGLILDVDFHKDFEGRVYAIPRRYLDSGLFKKKHFQGWRRTETGNAGFDQVYAVFASNEVLLHYVLTPALQEKFLHLKRKLGAEIFMSFQSGNLNMGVNWGRDLFECDFAKGIPSISEFENLSEDVQLFEDIVVSLSQERRIWGDKALRNQ